MMQTGTCTLLPYGVINKTVEPWHEKLHKPFLCMSNCAPQRKQRGSNSHALFIHYPVIVCDAKQPSLSYCANEPYCKCPFGPLSAWKGRVGLTKFHRYINVMSLENGILGTCNYDEFRWHAVYPKGRFHSWGVDDLIPGHGNYTTIKLPHYDYCNNALSKSPK